MPIRKVAAPAAPKLAHTVLKTGWLAGTWREAGEVVHMTERFAEHFIRIFQVDLKSNVDKVAADKAKAESDAAEKEAEAAEAAEHDAATHVAGEDETAAHEAASASHE